MDDVHLYLALKLDYYHLAMALLPNSTLHEQLKRALLKEMEKE